MNDPLIIKKTKSEKLRKITKDQSSLSTQNILSKEEYNSNFLNKIKSQFKNNYKLYNFIIDIKSPVFTLFTRKHLKKILKNLNQFEDKIIINIGSGNNILEPSIINVDIENYANVDFTCDITNMPFKDGSVDAIINIAVLEHLKYPQKTLDEAYRVLKKGGYIYSSIPFIQGFHASPYDFTRFTKEGIKVIHEKFEQTEAIETGGPTSGFLWITQEYFAILLSFGSKKLHLILTILFMLITFPLKFLDFLLQYHPSAHNISSFFTYIGKK